MKFVSLAILVVLSMCVLHCTTAQRSESSRQEEVGDEELQMDDVMIFSAEKSQMEQSNFRAKRSGRSCRFCCKNGHCGICCSF
ncbi:hepcidin-1-like [Megalops cyprinoides]|uniref:hepcidin-1-like n=1 Tax=Megalops cyprinoides TaxID=118141 RepID=UPI001864343F|nr:hepcidin-1-like [Megalops cyprinoides]XP_036377410.1 hepcidin-1-like [Megalops cyprinoides]